MDVDIEMCGMDQKFNALAGRTLLKKLKNKEKFVFITTLLENPKTGEKMMSKSLGTGVFLDFDADKMYGALMAQPDENMKQLFIDCTWLGMKEIDEILKIENPRDSKMRLAFEITKIYHGEKEAKNAEKNFVQTFQKRETPDEMQKFNVRKNSNIVDVLVESKLVKSKSEARRAISQGSIKVNGKKISESEIDSPLELSEKTIVQKGKRYFLELILE